MDKVAALQAAGLAVVVFLMIVGAAAAVHHLINRVKADRERAGEQVDRAVMAKVDRENSQA